MLHPIHAGPTRGDGLEPGVGAPSSTSSGSSTSGTDHQPVTRETVSRSGIPCASWSYQRMSPYMVSRIVDALQHMVCESVVAHIERAH